MIPHVTKAMGIWILVYLLLAHCLVIWNLQTPTLTMNHNNNNNTDGGRSLSATKGAVLYDTEVLPQPMLPHEEETYNQLYNMIQPLQSAILQSQERIQQQVQQQQKVCNTTRDIQSESVSDENDPNSLHQKYTRVLQLVSSLLPKPSIHDDTPILKGILLDVPTIRTMIPKLRQELHRWMLDQEWDMIQSILDALHIQLGNNENDSDDDDDDDDDDDIASTTATGQCTTTPLVFATREQLQTLIQNLQQNIILSPQQQQEKHSSLISKLPLSFRDSMVTLQQFLQRTLNDTIRGHSSSTIAMNDPEIPDLDQQDLVDRYPDSSSNSGNCIPSINWIHEWIDVGLDTIYRNSSLDLRRELLQAMYQHNNNNQRQNSIDMTNVMLDIPSFVTLYRTQQQAQQILLLLTTITLMMEQDNLRQYLDRPSIYELSVYIDTVLDYISGTNNVLDDIMDQYIYNNPHFVSSLPLRRRSTSTFLIGPSIVAYIMNGLGHVPLPSKALTIHTMNRMIFQLQSKINRHQTSQSTNE